MNNFGSSERLAIFKHIVRMNRAVIYPLLIVTVMISSLSAAIATTASRQSPYTSSVQTPLIPKLTSIKPRQQPKADSVVTNPPVTKPAPATKLTAPVVINTPKLVVAPVPVVQPVSKIAIDFIIRDANTTGWPMGDNVALDAVIVLNANYDTTRPITLAFTAPEGFYCPMVTILPLRTVQKVPFTCYLPTSLTMGHNSIVMSASNGTATTTASYDLNIISPTARS